MQTLRPYQDRALAELRARYRDNPILVAPTGSGKTTIAAHLVAGAISKGRRVLFLAHRKELITQAATRFLTYTPSVGIIKAGIGPTPDALVQVASVQTLVRRKPPPADIVIIDECHHASATTYQRVLSHYPDACRIGLTATPFRTDGIGLRNAGFGALVIAATPNELIAQGSLLEPRVFVGQKLPDLTGVRTNAGDYAPGELALRVDRPEIIADIMKNWRTYASDRLTVVFAASVAHSRHLVSAFGDDIAAHIDGTTPEEERDAILSRFADGDLRIVCNYGILTEGWDVPEAGACILARPTQSLGLLLQMAGRVLRPLPNKARPVILDHGGNTERHGFVNEDHEYSLDDAVKKKVPTETRQCKSCMAIFLAKPRRDTCPECGSDLAEEKKPREGPAHVDGIMVEVTPSEMTSAWYVKKIAAAAKSGFRIGWARWQFKKKHGRWPRFHLAEREHYRPFGEVLTYDHLASLFKDVPMTSDWRTLADYAAGKKRERADAWGLKRRTQETSLRHSPETDGSESGEPMWGLFRIPTDD